MTKKEKELVIKDLIHRLPYGVKCFVPELNSDYILYNIELDDENTLFDFWEDERKIQASYQLYISEFKPYLFPLSSITEEQWNNAPKVNLTDFTFESLKCGCFTLAFYTCENNLHALLEFINWLLANHFDIYGLIPKDLAIDATALGIYK
jgi:hypothetical protein